MDMTKVPQKPIQKVIVSIFLLVCFGGILYIYSNPNSDSLRYPFANVYVNNSSTKTCLNVLQKEHFQCTKDKTTNNPSATTTASKDQQETIVLIWMWPFGAKFDLIPCSTRYNIHGCHITADRNLYDQAHGVLIHHRDIPGDLSSMPQTPRPYFQKWIWWNMESPTNTYANGALKEVFNLTTSYRRTSDIYVPYGWLREATESEKNFTIPKKDKLVCWIVSHFEGHFRRSTYYYELVKHINVDAYGGHFKNRINDQDYSKIVSSCKFYLSFENSIHQDYFTEKVFNPLSLGTVPVVIGPPRQNYEMSIPSDSFIHVDDFPSPKELADHLKMLDQDEERYRQFFNWRKNFVSVGTPFGLEHACRVCYYLQQNKHYNVVKDLIGWFWG